MSLFQYKERLVNGKLIFPLILLIFFMILSVALFEAAQSSRLISFLLGLLACYSIITLFIIAENKKERSKVFSFLTGFTLPIFLLHTICAAPFRSILLKLGLSNATIQVSLGLLASLAGPILIAIIMKKAYWPEILIYPQKFLKV